MVDPEHNVPTSCQRKSPLLLWLLLFVWIALFSGCAGITTAPQPAPPTLFHTPTPAGLQDIHAPGFIVKNPEKQYNLIGSPAVRSTARGPEFFVDHSKPSIYFESQTFTTSKGEYQNLIYRIHFEKVPFSLTEPHLTTGKNPGIITIYTLDKDNRLLLITTVNSCGCFLAFLPTTNLDSNAYPEDWPSQVQHVYGYDLPTLLDLPADPASGRFVFSLEDGNHRISDVELIGHTSILTDKSKQIQMVLSPMSSLYKLPYNGSTTSFFELEGARKGYVKNNLKILERLFISWWAFDLRVGEDKAYGKDDKSTIPLYTSLKFWRRDDSDMKNFPRFLAYWGWKL